MKFIILRIFPRHSQFSNKYSRDNVVKIATILQSLVTRRDTFCVNSKIVLVSGQLAIMEYSMVSQIWIHHLQ